MCRARASCNVSTVFRCPSHRILSALVALEPAGKATLESCLCVFVSEQSSIVPCPYAVGVGESLELKSHCCHKKVVV